MKRYWRLGAAFLACLLALPTYYGSLLSQSDREVERKIIEYLKANLKAGQPVIVSKLHNEVFTSPEERKALDRLYNIFFKVPANFTIPDHWHTSAERMVLVSGELHVTYQGQPMSVLRPGMYAYGPARLAHKAVCVSREPCVLFIAFEAPVDAIAAEGGP